MKTIRHILIFILIILPQYILGQEMYVHSFSHVPSDLSAKVTPKNDTNRELCALVKVAFVEKDADFFGSVLKPVKRVSGIYWVYMPKGSYRLRVLHDSFLPLDIDFLSYPGVGKLESGETYELVIKTKGGDNLNNSVNGNFIVLNVTPEHASVKVDGKVITMNDKGEAKTFLNNGTHSYSIEANGYLPINEEVVISGERVTRNISLQFNRPSLSITTTTAGTEIYVNEERKGIDSWSGYIDEGTCLIEGRKTGYKNHKMTAEINAKNNSVTIPALIKAVGSLIVNYEPTDADIYLDNKYIGKTPNVINDIQIGQHELKISKDGYETFTKSLVVNEEQSDVSGLLKKSTSTISNSSNPSNLFDKGMQAFHNKDYKKAVKCFRKAKGNTKALCLLGYCYEFGHGVNQDYDKAGLNYAIAADLGDRLGKYLLGHYYEGGIGRTPNYNLAVELYREAAEQGYAPAQYKLGECYEKGKGVTIDLQEAIKWYNLGAKNGNGDSKKALERLGVSQ